MRGNEEMRFERRRRSERWIYKMSVKECVFIQLWLPFVITRWYLLAYQNIELNIISLYISLKCNNIMFCIFYKFDLFTTL